MWFRFGWAFRLTPYKDNLLRTVISSEEKDPDLLTLNGTRGSIKGPRNGSFVDTNKSLR